MSRTRSIRFAIECAVADAFVRAVRSMPRRVVLALGGVAGSVARRLYPKRAEIARENLRHALGDTHDVRERAEIARRCWKQFGRVAVDTLAFSKFDASSIGREVRYHGLEHIRGAYAAGHGVVLFSGHFGHWELAAYLQGHLGMPLALVTRPLDNRALENRLAALRQGSGNTLIHKRRGVRAMLRTLREGGGVAIVIDQDAREGGVFVPFLGRPASTSPTPALLALRTGAALVPVFARPADDGTYDITYEPPVVLPRSEDLDADVARLTARCTAILERWVRDHPTCWMWMHRRWKSVPQAAPPDGHPRARAAGDAPDAR